jgi:hypothetical protein
MKTYANNTQGKEEGKHVHKIRLGTKMIIPFPIATALYEFFLHFKPSEPFLVDYLIDDRGYTEDEVDNQIFPVATYATLAALLLITPLSERVFRYKWAIVLGSLARLVTRGLLLFARPGDVPAMQAMQVFYGIGVACETVLYGYIYTKATASEFSFMSSLTHASMLVSHLSSALLGQLLVSYAHVVKRIKGSWFFCLASDPNVVFSHGVHCARSSSQPFVAIHGVILCRTTRTSHISI